MSRIKHIALIAALMTLAACGGENAGKESDDTPSPIASFDKDRLWILTRASRVSDGRKCSDYYRAPDDPRYAALTTECDAWSLNFTEYLRINGLPTIEPAHVQSTTYWEWFKQKKAVINECRNALPPREPSGRITEASQERSRVFDACDPYDDATRNKKQTPSDMGINYP